MAAWWEGYIRRRARQLGIDPNAAIAVARQEGLGGGVGDAGTSYGPFQLHEGGALPRGRGRAWAESPAGIDYALRQIAGVARGQRGGQAVRSIVTRFERPADPSTEIARALGAYGSVPTSTQTAAAPTSTTGAATGNPRAALAQSLIAASQASTAHQTPDYMPALQAVQQIRLGTLATPAGTQVPVVSEGAPTPRDLQAVKLAKQYLGTPYVWGGSKPGGFDCSGLLQYIYAKQGVSIPRTTYDQIKAGRAIGKGQLRPGDAVFFGSSTAPHHVGVYIGNGRFIEAPHRGAVVRIANLAGRTDYAGARRYA